MNTESLTIDEKVALMTGDATWRTHGVARLGIGRLKLSDGPGGVRGERFATRGPTSVNVPCGAALGATWDVDLVERIGALLGREAHTKSAQVIFAPTINLHRTLLGGRSFECFSEDPLLTAKLAAAHVRGVQSQGVAACPKHLVGNDYEIDRYRVSSDIDEPTLREVYLLPFEAALRDAGAWVVMAAYNRVNGTYAAEHRWLLTSVLRDEWSWDGVVVSDYFGARSCAGSANAGLDLEMPGPSAHYGPDLAASVTDGQVPESVLDDAVARLLLLRERTACADVEMEERAVDRPEDRALVRAAAASAIVLLQNRGALLPLALDEISSIALIGPNASAARPQGGGSARVRPHYVVSPLDALAERCDAAGVKVIYEQGCSVDRGLPVLDERLLGGAARVTYVDESATLVNEEEVRGLDFLWWGDEGALQGKPFRVRIEADVVPRASGAHTFGVTAVGRSRVLLDGVEIVDNWTSPERSDAFFGSGSAEKVGVVDLDAGSRHALVVEYSTEHNLGLRGLTVGCAAPVPGDLIDRAIAAVAACDVAVVVVGMTEEWETEGRDRTDLDLPGDQDELVRRVHAANPRTVVVVNAGAPVTMDWADDVPAVLQAWYLGQEGGNALVDVLVGDAEPGGRLPTTFPRRGSDHPVPPAVARSNAYAEGVRVGHRGYEAAGIEPRFPFGHGLGYTRFEYGTLTASPARLLTNSSRTGVTNSSKVGGIGVSVEVTNVGDRAGSEVVQLYRVVDDHTRLTAFARVHAAPGASATATFDLSPRDLATFGVDERAWVLSSGTIELRVGTSSRDTRATATLDVAEPWSEPVGPPPD